MDTFPRTKVDGVSLPRMIIGSNWFFGFSHTSWAKDKHIKDFQNRKNVADIFTVFMKNGVDAVMLGHRYPEFFTAAVKDAEDKTGKKMIIISTPSFNILPGGKPEDEPEKAFDICKKMGAVICMPHQSVTDSLLDKMHGEIRDIGKYTKMIRERGMVPGLSTHAPESVVIADKTNADIQTYIQLYNADGFLMQVEVDWVMRVIKNAKKPVITIKPLAAGRILPPVGLAFVWNTIRDIDMVTVGTTTPDEAEELIELSMSYLDKRLPDNKLQKTRSKQTLE